MRRRRPAPKCGCAGSLNSLRTPPSTPIPRGEPTWTPPRTSPRYARTTCRGPTRCCSAPPPGGATSPHSSRGSSTPWVATGGRACCRQGGPQDRPEQSCADACGWPARRPGQHQQQRRHRTRRWPGTAKQGQRHGHPVHRPTRSGPLPCSRPARSSRDVTKRPIRSTSCFA